MRCDTCHQEAAVVMRVAVAKDYNRLLARAVYNCPACFERKDRGRGPTDAGRAPAGAARPGRSTTRG